MGVSMKYVVFMYIFAAASSMQHGFSESVITCKPKFNSFLHDLRFQCPLEVSYSSPIEVDGESLDIALSFSHPNLYAAVLFYSSWCPFSRSVGTKFASLSSMFPQIKHLMVEQSSVLPRLELILLFWREGSDVSGEHSALPIVRLLAIDHMIISQFFVMLPNIEALGSFEKLWRFAWVENVLLTFLLGITFVRVFSRYGIHSVPLIMIVNQTTRERYHGPKDLFSLVRFYKKTTGLDPVVDLGEDEVFNSEDTEFFLQPWNRMSLTEAFMKEPYLVLSIMFLSLMAFLYFFSEIPSRLMALWVAYKPHIKLGIFGESRQLLGRVLHLIDIKGVWSKLQLCKTRNFHRGARSARVWASSLASVSLGETPTARALLSGDS